MAAKARAKRSPAKASASATISGRDGGPAAFARLWIGELAEARRSPIEIESRGGFVVRVGPGMDRATLIETLSAIEALGEARVRGR